MIILYDEASGAIRDFYFDAESFRIPPVHPYQSIEVDEEQVNKAEVIKFIRSFRAEDGKYMIVNGEMQRDGINVVWSVNADKAQLRSEYQQTIQTLTDIEIAASPTNAQVVAAIRFLSKTIKLILKLLYRLYSL